MNPGKKHQTHMDPDNSRAVLLVGLGIAKILSVVLVIFCRDVLCEQVAPIEWQEQRSMFIAFYCFSSYVATMMSCPLPMPLPIIPSLHEFSPVHIGVKCNWGNVQQVAPEQFIVSTNVDYN
uniref:Uncharacterized protein n=1 Tax=Glossina austeni TaxID=7395 RepID=A0A1A9V6B9_GLOAU